MFYSPQRLLRGSFIPVHQDIYVRCVRCRGTLMGGDYISHSQQGLQIKHCLNEQMRHLMRFTCLYSIIWCPQYQCSSHILRTASLFGPSSLHLDPLDVGRHAGNRKYRPNCTTLPWALMKLINLWCQIRTSGIARFFDALSASLEVDNSSSWDSKEVCSWDNAAGSGRNLELISSDYPNQLHLSNCMSLLIKINSINQELLPFTNGCCCPLMIIHESGWIAPAHWWRLRGGGGAHRTCRAGWCGAAECGFFFFA